MNELIYSILRYAPSLVSGEKMNLAVVFYHPDTNYREFYSISRWNRVASFDNTLCIPLLKDVILDMKDAVGTNITAPDFNIKKFCAKYHSDLYFDECETLPDVSEKDISTQIEEVKHMYFQFEFDLDQRPKREDQKKFLSRILKGRHISYTRNIKKVGKFKELITFDYTFQNCGVKFFNFNLPKIDGATLNMVKAWAWNCNNRADASDKILILYDLEDEEREDVRVVLNILKSASDDIMNIHDGFGDITTWIERNIS